MTVIQPTSLLNALPYNLAAATNTAHLDNSINVKKNKTSLKSVTAIKSILGKRKEQPLESLEEQNKKFKEEQHRLALANLATDILPRLSRSSFSPIQSHQTRTFLLKMLNLKHISKHLIMIALLYIHKLMASQQKFDFSVDYALVVCLSLAEMQVNDANIPMKKWSTFSHLDLNELLRVKVNVLQILNWKTNVAHESYKAWLTHVSLMSEC